MGSEPRRLESTLATRTSYSLAP